MSETKGEYITATERPETMEPEEILRILAHVGMIKAGSGWGEVRFTLKDGRLDEIAVTMTEKYRKVKPCP